MRFLTFILFILGGGFVLYLIFGFFTTYNEMKKAGKFKKPIPNTPEAVAVSPNGLFRVSLQESVPPLPDKKYSSLDDWKKDTKVVWQVGGDPLNVEFSYRKWDKIENKSVKERRFVQVEQILTDSRNLFYIRGHCRARDEARTFKMDNIGSKILHKSKRYDQHEFLEKLHVFDNC